MTHDRRPHVPITLGPAWRKPRSYRPPRLIDLIARAVRWLLG